MSKLIRIAFTGKMRSGKSEAATILGDKYGLNKLSFGGALKKSADYVFPTNGMTEKRRKLYQEYGTKMREIDPCVWVNKVDSRYNDMLDIDKGELKGFVIDDLRQPNEYRWAVDNGFYIVRINTNEVERVRRSENLGDRFEPIDMLHETERHVEGFDVDYEIDNMCDVFNLESELDKIIKNILDLRVGK